MTLDPSKPRQSRSKILPLSFKPLPLLKNPHLQTIVSNFTFAGASPPSEAIQVTLPDGDILSCEVSTPYYWKPSEKTVFLVHGLTGSHESNYMIRLARKSYEIGHRVVRINLRGCGSGKDLSAKPFHSGKSDDITWVLRTFKELSPDSPFVLVGFSVGGNIVLKLAGELEKSAKELLEKTIAVCPPVDLFKCIQMLCSAPFKVYHDNYVQNLRKYGKLWLNEKPFNTLFEFDQLVTVPVWGFKNTEEFYLHSSSCYYLSKIQHPCHIIFAADDPMIDYKAALKEKLHSCVNVWISPQGGHMGFLGGLSKNVFWLDSLLLQWI